MRNYKIITDSTCDLPPHLIKELDLHVIPMEFVLDGISHFHDLEDHGEKIASFYEKLRDGKSSTTSMINTQRFLEIFESYLEEGLDILHISFSSGLSGTYNASRLAQIELQEKYPDQKIYLVDSLAASIGQGLLVYHAAMKKKEGHDLDALHQWVEQEKKNVSHWFTVEDLMHLKRGGRISALSANVGTALSIKPILSVNLDGKLITQGKVMGRKKSLGELVNLMKATILSPEEQVILIGHGDSLEDAELLAKKIQKEIPVKEILFTYIGPVIGSHTGPGMIGVTFLGRRSVPLS